MEKERWCDYVCEEHRGCILTYQRALQEGRQILVWSSDGIRLTREGRPVSLWLLRGDRAVELVRRNNNQFVVLETYVEMQVNKTGLHILNHAPGLLTGDGFEILPEGTIPRPGSKSGTVLE